MREAVRGPTPTCPIFFQGLLSFRESTKAWGLEEGLGIGEGLAQERTAQHGGGHFPRSQLCGCVALSKLLNLSVPWCHYHYSSWFICSRVFVFLLSKGSTGPWVHDRDKHKYFPYLACRSRRQKINKEGKLFTNCENAT